MRSGRDVVRRTVGWQRELADRACRRDAPDLAALPFGVRNAHHFGKPEGVVRSGRDAGRLAARWQRELADRARRRDAPDLAALEFGKPEVAICPGRDAHQVAAGWNWGVADLASRGDAPDLAGEGCAVVFGDSVCLAERTRTTRPG